MNKSLLLKKKWHDYIFVEQAYNSYVRYNEWKAVRDVVTDK